MSGATDLPVLVDSSGKLGTGVSSIRFKQDVRDLGAASEVVMELRPVRFRYCAEKVVGADVEHYGLIAEEVEEVAPQLVAHDADGRPYAVRYHQLTPLLLAEMQRQQRTIDEQRARMARLESRLDARGASGFGER